MRNSFKYILLIGYVFLTSPLISARNNSINRFAQVVDSLHDHIVLPQNIAPGIVLTNIGVDKNDKMLVINYMLNPGLVESVARNVSSENGIAQLLTGYDEIFSISMIEAEAGCRIIITSPSSDGINKTKIVDVPASAIPVVYDKLKRGVDHSPLKPYLEMLQSTFSNLQFPLKIVDGIYLTEAYIKEKEAHWVYRIEGVVDVTDISDAMIQNSRINLTNNLRSVMSADYVKEIEEKGISLHYTYHNIQGDVLFEYVFTATDLK